MIVRKEFPGIFGDCLPAGEYVYSTTGLIHTHFGSFNIPLPEDYLMFNKITNIGAVKIASKGHNSDKLHIWNNGWFIDGRISHGVQGHAYDPNGILHVIQGQPNQESQGLRYYDSSAPANIANFDITGQTRGFVTGSPSYNPFTALARHYGVNNLYEWTHLEGIIVGQGPVSGTIIQYQGKQYLLYPDKVSDIKENMSRFVQFHLLNDRLAITTTDLRNNKVIFDWLDITDITSRSIFSESEPTPIGEPMIRAFERPLWQAPYFSHHARYGDTEPSKHVGNAIAVIGDDSNIERFNDLGMPLIVDTNVPNPTFNLDLTIAWLTHGGPIDETIQNSNNALSLPEKPIIAYNDGREWPSSDPFTNDRIWPSIQAYRGPSEPLDSFRIIMTAIIERVSSYNRPMCLVPRFDDFNGSSTIQRTLECMHLYEQWLREFNFVACMPFSDRRGNAISKNESLWNWARAFQYAIPFERPNRFDYWRPSGLPISSILKNKFGQTRASIVIEPYLRTDITSKYTNSEPEPGEWPDLLPTIERVRAKYPRLINVDQSVAIVNEVAWIHRNQRFGLLRKESGNHGLQPRTEIQCSVDWIVNKAFKRGLDCLVNAPNRDAGNSDVATPNWNDGESWNELDRFVEPVEPI